ncbi:unnamed protein product [Rotaria magnacalcarata]|uniref:Uncharacterized protein n=1 Tax=Rotaria magnacalcarata TaxID=392030 RepID=A0A816XED2_9BILA|nr:unnamed protein product [Rotaria magnacalcarata]CAF1375547.1 unnamed protein product [Rotaria magnacalcarata]CAF1986235.1 unnamed protein product [Rotaria magnacalcarata]CAF2032700.1 unnamed protein product [Rotaria magnacalcarata]CAF2145734.1 unnamed protein product [Rotaria magnacalcarata]
MDARANLISSASNREGRPLRRRGVSFNVLPIREEPPSIVPSEAPILLDYSSIRERKQLSLNDFLHSDNPITFFLFTFWHAACFFAQLFILPFVIIKYLYLLMLRVYGVRRPTTSTTTSDLFSDSSSSSSPSQQRPIVWILTFIDYIIIQLSRLPETMKHCINSTSRHIDGTVSKSFNLLDGCVSHLMTRTYSVFKSKVFPKSTYVESKTKR